MFVIIVTLLSFENLSMVMLLLRGKFRVQSEFIVCSSEALPLHVVRR